MPDPLLATLADAVLALAEVQRVLVRDLNLRVGPEVFDKNAVAYEAVDRLRAAWNLRPESVSPTPYQADPRCGPSCHWYIDRQRHGSQQILCNVHEPNPHHADALEHAKRDAERAREQVAAQEALVAHYEKLVKEGAPVPSPAGAWKPPA